MDNEMIERCITAVREQFQKAKTQQAPFDRVDYKDIVLAVIKAMREPTEKMLNVVGLAIAADLPTDAVIRNMIDSIANDR